MQVLPPIWPIQGKTWGTTQCIFKTDTVEIWHINIKKGGYCSEHFHDYKWNRFFILHGNIKVKIFRDESEDELIDETILGPGQATDVHPKLWHVFEALEDTEALEVYWVSLDPGDIQRRTHGGVHDE